MTRPVDVGDGVSVHFWVELVLFDGYTDTTRGTWKPGNLQRFQLIEIRSRKCQGIYEKVYYLDLSPFFNRLTYTHVTKYEIFRSRRKSMAGV
jgi:hypothetical protein